jgi:hypothetical protein
LNARDFDDAQRRAVSSLAIIHEVPFDLAELMGKRAFRRYRGQCLHPQTWFKLLETELARHPRRPIVSVQRWRVERWGPASNVVRCSFKLYGPNQGVVAAEVLTLADVRYELRCLHKNSLSDAVQGKPVANDNDPALTVQPHWHTTVQAAWVRRVVSARGAS